MPSDDEFGMTLEANPDRLWQSPEHQEEVKRTVDTISKQFESCLQSFIGQTNTPAVHSFIRRAVQVVAQESIITGAFVERKRAEEGDQDYEYDAEAPFFIKEEDEVSRACKCHTAAARLRNYRKACEESGKETVDKLTIQMGKEF